MSRCFLSFQRGNRWRRRLVEAAAGSHANSTFPPFLCHVPRAPGTRTSALLPQPLRLLPPSPAGPQTLSGAPLAGHRGGTVTSALPFQGCWQSQSSGCLRPSLAEPCQQNTLQTAGRGHICRVHSLLREQNIPAVTPLPPACEAPGARISCLPYSEVTREEGDEGRMITILGGTQRIPEAETAAFLCPPPLYLEPRHSPGSCPLGQEHLLGT